jgi:hypothetical protein
MIVKILETFVSATLIAAMWVYRRDHRKANWIFWAMILWLSLTVPELLRH